MLRVAAALAGLLVASAAAAAPLGGISYSPSGIKTYADLAKGIDEAHIRADLALLKPLTDEIRLYTTDHGLDRAVPIAAEMGFKVTVGIFL